MTPSDRGTWFRALILIQFVGGSISISTEHWRGAATAALCLLATIAVLLTVKEEHDTR